MHTQHTNNIFSHITMVGIVARHVNFQRTVGESLSEQNASMHCMNLGCTCMQSLTALQPCMLEHTQSLSICSLNLTRARHADTSKQPCTGSPQWRPSLQLEEQSIAMHTSMNTCKLFLNASCTAYACLPSGRHYPWLQRPFLQPNLFLTSKRDGRSLTDEFSLVRS